MTTTERAVIEARLVVINAQMQALWKERAVLGAKLDDATPPKPKQADGETEEAE